MNFTILTTMILLSSFGVSCGQNKASHSNPATIQMTEEQAAVIQDSRYSTIEIGADSFSGDYEHQIKMELNQRPLIISAKYNSTSVERDGDNRSCSFDLEVSEIQAKKIQELADKLRICTFQDETGIIIDADAQYIVLNDNHGNEISGNKDLLGMDGERYLCQGKKDFYDYIQRIIAKDAQNEACPNNALSSMF